MPLADLIVDVVGYILGDVIGGGIAEVADRVRGKPKGTSRKRLAAARSLGARGVDEKARQLWTDALVAAAHLDDSQLDDTERGLIERGLRALGAFADGDGAVMLENAEKRVKTEDPWAIVEQAVSECDDKMRETLAGAVVAVAMAGTGSRAHIDKVLKRVRGAGSFDDRAWETLMSEARARVGVVRKKRSRRASDA